jgi:MoaA/NifB/PqqE/SkfB family radical SAM enzyme
MRIGHLDDADLAKKILTFERECWCTMFRAKLAHAAPTDRIRRINIEVSLACNGDCAMCCVHAPEWKGNYSFYDQLDRLLDELHPERIHVQGGEVLVQPRTLRWLEGVRQRHPGMALSLATNGNVEIGKLDVVEKIFNDVFVSIVGFQPLTYKTIMGLEFDRMNRFVSELIRRGTTGVQLKFMLGPLNTHEASAFVDWAASLGPRSIAFGDTSTLNHLRLDAPFNFWEKILQRSSNDLQAALIRNMRRLQEVRTVVLFEPPAAELLRIREDWIKANQLEDIVRL